MQDLNNENTLPTKAQPEVEANKRTVDETAPTRLKGNDPAPVQAATQPSPVKTAPPKRMRRWPWFLLGFLLIFLLGGGGTYLGYRSAIDLRKSKQAEAVVTIATQQFMLGLQAQENGQYAIARQHFEYVIQLDPNFPGAAEKLTEVLIAQMATTTPTPEPTPTVILPTPTPDTRTQEEIFNTARQQYVNQEWDALMVTIDSLRGVDPSYRSIEIDGMLYMALRFRGIRKIYQEANLEGGIYDLALSERFAPLDSDALGARNWARLYLNGVSFWGADWARVVRSFEEIYPYFPNLRDSTGMTAVERFRAASLKHAEALNASGDPCGALEYYNKALSVAADGAVELKATEVYLACYPPTQTPMPTETPTPTVEVPVVVTTEAPPAVETTPPPAETPLPSDTPSSGG